MPNGIHPVALSAQIAKGAFQPNIYLTNMSMAYFQDATKYAAKVLFPICPVQLSSARYYIFDKASLLRDNAQRKPEFGKVSPAQMGLLDQSYSCKVDQIIVGIDQISALNFQRTSAPGAVDPRRAKIKFIAEQMNLHQDRLFAEQFFKPSIWSNEWSGSTAYSASGKTFIKFSDDNCDPVRLIDDLCTEIEQNTGRRPNRLGLGKNAYNALKNHPGVVERVKFGGSTANPAYRQRARVSGIIRLTESSRFIRDLQSGGIRRSRKYAIYLRLGRGASRLRDRRASRRRTVRRVYFHLGYAGRRSIYARASVRRRKRHAHRIYRGSLRRRYEKNRRRAKPTCLRAIVMKLSYKVDTNADGLSYALSQRFPRWKAMLEEKEKKGADGLSASSRRSRRHSLFLQRFTR